MFSAQIISVLFVKDIFKVSSGYNSCLTMIKCLWLAVISPISDNQVSEVSRARVSLTINKDMRWVKLQLWHRNINDCLSKGPESWSILMSFGYSNISVCHTNLSALWSADAEYWLLLIPFFLFPVTNPQISHGTINQREQVGTHHRSTHCYSIVWVK